ncbi:MAG: translation elongation factor Ts, partial [Phycisphaerales bacterium]|nr:translation elongation factor Ts [Phycisphaerales bacterium]
MAITAAQVNELRQKTGLGMMECKKALEESAGDVQKAVDLLRTKGLAKMDSRAERVSAEGRIALAVSHDRTKAAMVEINSETDFVAKNEKFLAVVQSIAQEALTQPAGPVTKSDSMQAGIDDQRLTTKENVQFGRGEVVGGPGSTVGGYVHFTGKIGVLIELTGPADTITNELIADLTEE